MVDAGTSLFDQLEAAIVTSVIDDTKFLPLDSLDNIITIDAIARNLPVQTGAPAKLISYFRNFWWAPTPLAEQIEQRLKRVFTILVMIGHLSNIEELLNDGLTDKDLPLARKDNTKLLLSRTTGKEFTSFKNWDSVRVSQFLEKQSIVQCPVLKAVGQDLVVEDKFPLPFIERGGKIGGGSGVFVHQVRIHPAHCSEAFARAAGGLVAVKEIQDQKAFITERGNLESMKKIPHKHLIQTLGTIERGSLFYVIFPWAHGGDVRQFWEHHQNNLQDPKLVKWSLEQMLGLANGIMTLHKDNIRHGDIKPQNVLHFKPTTDDGLESSGLGTLVIADVGVSKRHTQATNVRNWATSTSAVTISYEAPEAEYDRENGIPRSRKYDQWSLGCMYLEFIVWLLYGFQAVEVFRSRRTASREDPTTAPGNFFTQRSYGPPSIHSRVTKAIEHLRKDPRCGEHTAFGDLVTVVDARLLQIAPGDRADAEELSRILQKIYTEADNDADYLCKPVGTIPIVPKFFLRRHRRSSSSDTRGSRSSISSTAASGRSSLSSVAAVEEEPLAEKSG